jgi:hypothetical protein
MDYYTHVILEPDIPEKYFGLERKELFIENAGFQFELVENNYYLFAKNGIDMDYENDVLAELKKIFKEMLMDGLNPSPFRLLFVFTASRMDPDGFGAYAYFITDKVKYYSINEILQREIDKYQERKNKDELRLR